MPGGQRREPQQHQRPDTSRSTSGPLPAACERTSDFCSWARISVGMCRVASAPNPVEMPYAGVGRGRELLDDRRGPARSPSARRRPARRRRRRGPPRPRRRRRAGRRRPRRRVRVSAVAVLMPHSTPPARLGARAARPSRVSDPRQLVAAMSQVPPPRARCGCCASSPASRTRCPLDRHRRGRAACRARTAYHLLTAMIEEGFVVAPGRGAPLRPRRGGVRGGQRLRPAGAAAADRPAAARRARRRGRAERAPRGAARPRRALRPRGAGARPAAAGHRRRRPAARRTSPPAAGRSWRRCRRPRCARSTRTATAFVDRHGLGPGLAERAAHAAARDPAARLRRPRTARSPRASPASPRRCSTTTAPGRRGRGHLRRRDTDRADPPTPCARTAAPSAPASAAGGRSDRSAWCVTRS